MPNNNNDDIINNILDELERKKNHNDDMASEYHNDDMASESAGQPEEPVEIREEATNDEQEKQTEIPEAEQPQHDTGRSSENGNYQENVKIRKVPNKSRERQDNPQNHKPVRENEAQAKKKKKRSHLPGVLILMTFIFAVSICLSLVIIAYGKDMLGIGKSETTHLIIIEEGATTEEIAALLEEEGIIKSPEFFTLFSQLSGSDIEYIAGEHFLRPDMAYETIIQELTSSESEQKTSVEVTFPEGITLYDAAVLLEENGVCSIDDFLFYFNAGDLGFEFESKLSARSSLKFYQMEGYLFPDTYYFYEDMDPKQVCQKIYMNFDNKMTDERYEKMEDLNLTLDQLITFASIVQQESATQESMTLVASVFWNRLNHQNQFPLLQSEPTRFYAENVIKPHMEVYDQVIIDAYNTYVSTGLTPGPICNPGTDAINAVLEAFESDYYYFIANVNTGETYFSTTLEEHEAYQAMIEEQMAEEENQEEE